MSDIPPQTDPTEPEGVRNLREALEREKAKAAAGELAQRKLAFIEAGIPVADGSPGALLFKAYDGELDAEAIQAEAAKFGIVPGTQEPTPPPVTPPEQVPPAHDPTQTATRSLLGSETIDPGTPVPEGDPMGAAYTEYHRLKAEGMTGQEASVAVLGKIFEQARAGNEDFIFDATAWQSSEAAQSR